MSCPPARASTVGKVEKTCPFDGTKIEAWAPMSGTSFGSRFDLQPVGPIISPYPFLVCPDGFIFYKDEFSSDELGQLKPLLSSTDFQALKDDSVHYRAAWLQERTGAPPQDVATSLLHATWEAQSPQTYAKYASKLLDVLERAIPAEPNLRKRQRLQLLKGEMLRRLGRFDEARVYFERLAGEVAGGTDEGTVIKLQLAMVAARNTANETIPEEELKAARAFEAWLVARRPILSSNSRLGTVVSQFRTAGSRGFIWSHDSAALYAAGEEDYFKSVIHQHSIIARPTMPELEFGYSRPNLLASLPNGNLLILFGPRADSNPDIARLVEVNPVTGQQVNSTRAPDFTDGLFGPTPVSFDGKLVFLQAASLKFTAYSTPASAVVSIPGGAGKDERAWELLAAAPDAPLIVAQARKEAHLPATGLVVWNYERQRPEHQFAADGLERDDYIVDVALSAATGALTVLRWRFQPSACEVGFYDLATGRLQVAHHADGRPASLSRSPDGRYVAFGCGAKVELFDTSAPWVVLETIRTPLDLQFKNVRFSPDSRYLAFETDNVVTVFSVR